MPLKEGPYTPYIDAGGGRNASREFTPGTQAPTPQQLAYEKEQARQAQIALAQKLKEQQGVSDVATNATSRLAKEKFAADAASQESSQGFQGGQAGLNREASAASQASAQGANAASQASAQGFQGEQADLARAADAARQHAAFTEAARSQGVGIGAALKGQTQSEAARLGLQNASDATSKGLQTEKLGATQRLQAQAEAEAARAQTSDQAYGSSTLDHQAKLQAEAEARRMEYLKGLLGDAGGVGGVGTPGSGTEEQAISAQEDSARTAAFARAKDQAGLIGRSAISGLQNQAAGRGIGAHSGIATSQVGQVINQGATQLGDVNREQAISAAANARQRASEKLSAATTRRGQNISLISGLVNAKAY